MFLQLPRACLILVCRDIRIAEMSTSPSNNKLYLLSAMLWFLTVGLWIVLWFFNPYSQTETVTIPGLVMLFVATTGVVSSFLKKPILLLTLALLSFFPIGLYLLGTPGIFLNIGLLNVVSVVVAARLLFMKIRPRAMPK